MRLSMLAAFSEFRDGCAHVGGIWASSFTGAVSTAPFIHIIVDLEHYKPGSALSSACSNRQTDFLKISGSNT